jgi:hypothetical protein
VQAFEKILKQQSVSAIGLNFFKFLAFTSFGMSVIKLKFSLNMSSVLSLKYPKRSIKSSFMTSQFFDRIRK